MIGIALHMDYLRRDVLGAVADRIDQHSAAHRAIGAGGTRFGGARDLQLLELRVCRLKVEAEDGGCGAADTGDLEELSTIRRHGTLLTAGTGFEYVPRCVGACHANISDTLSPACRGSQGVCGGIFDAELPRGSPSPRAAGKITRLLVAEEFPIPGSWPSWMPFSLPASFSAGAHP